MGTKTQNPVEPINAVLAALARWHEILPFANSIRVNGVYNPSSWVTAKPMTQATSAKN